MIKYVVILLFVIIILIILPLLRHPFLARDKLGTCSNVSQNIIFKCPSGHNYRLVFGVPKKEGKFKVSFVGTVTIYQKGVQIHRLVFDPNELKEGNWLNKEGLDAYILNSIPGSFSILDSYIKKNEEYEADINFREIPPDGTSLWLCYLRHH
jgi:hypothetical protein